MKLSDRDWKIIVGLGGVQALNVSELDCEFKVKKSLAAEPNCASLSIYNLTTDHRKLIEASNIYEPRKVKGAPKDPKKTATNVPRAPKVGKIRVEIEAGYKKSRSLIFRGDLRRAVSKWDENSVCTEIEGEDGGRSVLGSRINETIQPGTSKLTVVKALADAVGLGMGNIISVQDYLKDTFEDGTVLTGQAYDELIRVLRGAQLTCSIQNGVLQFLPTGALADKIGLKTKAILLNQRTGLIGAPQRDIHGSVVATCLMIPDVAPGGYVQLDSDQYKGNYLIYGVETTGQTWDNTWQHELELKSA